MPELTREQKWARDAKGGTVLVSAAAGSGKTKVLIERVMSLITDKYIDEDGNLAQRGKKTCDVDRLLIVTFTRAAAAELRQRLSVELAKLIAKCPEDGDLRRQKMLLPKAEIGTMDSFCAGLVRKNFAAAQVAPDFRIITGAELTVLRADVLEELMDMHYAEGSERFMRLAELLSGAKNDNALYRAVDDVEHFADGFPDAEEKLREMAQMYDVNALPQNTPWGQTVIEYTKAFLDYAVRVCEYDIELLSGDERLCEKLGDAYELYHSGIKNALSAADGQGWDALHTALENIVFPAFNSVSRVKSDIKPMLQASRSIVSDTLKEKILPKFALSESDFVRDSQSLCEPVNTLCELAVEFRSRLDEAMSQRKVLGHSDVAHKAFGLLCERDGEKYVRTPIAKELSERYTQIMIDEFQDTNDVQNLIFCAVAKQDADEIGDGSNAFVVGDIKQSIYGFRRAVPALFLDRFVRYSRYAPENEVYPAKIVLDRNFRSRPEVTESVNFFFSHLMRSEIGSIEYDDDQKLVSGRRFPKADNMDTELHIASAEGAEGQAEYCARMIKKMLDEGFEVTDGDGMRPVRPEDICIMLRAVGKESGAVYADALKKLAVPVTIAEDKSLFAAQEVSVVLSLLRAIDNPTNSVSLVAALRSPIFGYDCDALAGLADRDRDDSVYKKLVSLAASGDNAAKGVIERLAVLRERAARMPVDRLIVSIYSETGFLSAVQAMTGGEARRDNLIAFSQFAKSFESSGSHGLTRFLRMVDRIIECGERSSMKGGLAQGCVTVSTIHATKGLEYPVCIIANAEKKFNDEWKKNNLQLHRRLGLGIKLRDSELGAKYPTLQRSAVVLANELDNTAEELRVLYVAMTRAVDKLIVLCSPDHREKMLSSAAGMIVDGEIAPFSVSISPSYAKWVCACAMLHADGAQLCGEAAAERRICPSDCRLKVVIEKEREPEEEITEQAQEVSDTEADCGDISEMSEMIAQRLHFRYPYEELCRAPSKVTASQVHPDSEISFAERPSFMTEGGLSATERGTALHRFMQYADFAAAAVSPGDELERLRAAGVLSETEAKAVDLEKVAKFFDGEVGRMIASAERVEREWRFTASLDADMRHHFPECEGDYPVVLEGECDCLLISGNKAQIIDYKTDRAFEGAQGLVRRYAPQLELYASAVKQILPVEITGLYIYSFDLSELISLF
ncbi:MAG: helicase-exonuclease AddAB subunit AddA [Ruminococcaceae bacterium]|nr:helicase-exonuclease AddAB subunit AddA [Oscillospiraceae bacterium]